MYHNEKSMQIVKAANGWILTMPKASDSSEAMKQMIQAIPGAIRKNDEDPMLSGVNYIEVPKYEGHIDFDTYIFTSFKNMMSFLKLHFEDFEQ